MTSIGFIILRHVNSNETNKYWIHCYECIRKYYPENEIVIIDDNSKYEFIEKEKEKKLYKTQIIKSEYHGRGELLPYYYYYSKQKFFDTAVIIHDSVFINKYIDFNVDSYKILWEFEHYWDQIEDETVMIKSFNDEELYKFYQDKNLWKGCFGGMSVITYDFLNNINNKYNFSNLLQYILNRGNRCSFERVIGCLLQKEHKPESDVLLGNIHAYMPWGVNFVEKDNYSYLPIIKVWTGR